jgi:hypothetical protein
MREAIDDPETEAACRELYPPQRDDYGAYELCQEDNA